jgi:hypothetical protein
VTAVRQGAASLGDRLEAAAISMKMIAVKAPGDAACFLMMAQRFAVDEAALREAVGSRATERAYDRIHSNTAWPPGSGTSQGAA